MEKKILGLDLGVGSIGWALVKENGSGKEIVGMGSRIIPLNTDDKDEFSAGNAISKNQKRTARRTQRKGYDRYQLRRSALTQKLLQLNMFPGEDLLKLKPIELWGLRSKAVTDKVELKELGRILYHLNQKRGYKSSRGDSSLDKKETEYVAEVKNRYEILKEQGLTIGQKFYYELQLNQYYRTKQQVFPREAYIEEFEGICKKQKQHYPDIITDELIAELRDEIIYFQRKLKSQKGLVNVCEFEGFWTKTSEGKEVFAGPRVAPKSSPLFQVCKIWESINSIRLRNKKGEELQISIEKKLEIFSFLDNNEKLSSAKLFDILGLKRNEGWYSNKQIERGLQGNVTKSLLLKLLKAEDPRLKFQLNISQETKEVFLVDKNTGEITKNNTLKIINRRIENEPLYRLWHTIYSISDVNECTKALVNNFGIESNLAENLAKVDFNKFGFGSKSAKAIRKTLPYLMEGYVYSDACSFAGYQHSTTLSSSENSQRKLLDVLPNLPKNSLRQPVVEKILNQMVNLVNAVIKEYGKPDEIRVELARELKQSKDERNESFLNLSKRERENETIRKRLIDEYALRATRNNVIKWRLFHEISNDESKTNATCIYCGKMFGITDALKGDTVDIEHIIPKSLLFDDSQSNKTLSHRSCNQAKDNKTAYDYMLGKGETEFNQYLERVDFLFKNKVIGKAKRDKLLLTEAKIPKDFIQRQLRETQYIARKSKEILEQVCKNVWSTSGNVTEYLRRVWGWNDVLMNLQMPKYRELGLTESKDWETDGGQKHKKEVIKDWSKRDDHRHHAIDALAIACTQQGFIQRINNLSSKGNRDEMYAELGGEKKKGSLLENYLVAQRPFTTKDVEKKASFILVSFKAGKKVATVTNRKVKKDGRNVIVQKDIIVPRGSLSEESVYGKIRVLEKKPVKSLFENPELILKPYIKDLVKQRLSECENNAKKAVASVKKNPIYLDSEKTKQLEFASCFKEEYVIKYPLQSIKAKDAEHIVDERIRSIVKERLAQFNNKEKEAFREPIYLNEKKKIPIRSVRMFTGLSSVEPVKKDNAGKPIGFVKPGNNHHIVIYLDADGRTHEHICSFWHAVERKMSGLPVIIEQPALIWNIVLSQQDKFSQEFLNKLPADTWKFLLSLQQNEMFLLGIKPDKAKQLIAEKNYCMLSDYLYRVQKIANNDYFFRHHLETQVGETDAAKSSKRYYRFKSISALMSYTPVKVKVNLLGKISEVTIGGEILEDKQPRTAYDQTHTILRQSGKSQA